MAHMSFISLSDDNFYIGCVFDFTNIFTYFGTGSACDDPTGCASTGHSFMAIGMPFIATY